MWHRRRCHRAHHITVIVVLVASSGGRENSGAVDVAPSLPSCASHRPPRRVEWLEEAQWWNGHGGAIGVAPWSPSSCASCRRPRRVEWWEGGMVAVDVAPSSSRRVVGGGAVVARARWCHQCGSVLVVVRVKWWERGTVVPRREHGRHEPRRRHEVGRASSLRHRARWLRASEGEGKGRRRGVTSVLVVVVVWVEDEGESEGEGQGASSSCRHGVVRGG
ncbi:hypothetical protein OG21DRAFT_898974 [Imleria badia]|nr:hypothetical protein OG21DRAFT_898974 [Imleria badia]